MSIQLVLRCACGAVQGAVPAVTRAHSNRVVCYCDDCQAYARFLGREGLTDARGGTDVVQVRPWQVRFRTGFEQVRAVRLREKGLLRCYASCCRTPVGNTLATPRSPFVGLLAATLSTLEGGPLEAAVGAPSGAIQGRFAQGGCPEGVAPRVGAAVLARSAAFVLGNVVRGAHRGSPYFDERTGAVRVPVAVLTGEERARYGVAS